MKRKKWSAPRVASTQKPLDLMQKVLVLFLAMLPFYLLLFYKRKPCIFLVATLGPRALITQEQHVLVDWQGRLVGRDGARHRHLAADRGSSNERRRGYQVNTLYTHSKRHGPRKKNKISCSLVHLINYFFPWDGWLTYSNGVLKAMCWRELEWSEYGTDLGRHCTCAGAITSEVIKSMIYIAYTTRRCVCISLLLLVRWTMWNALQKQASCQARGTGRTG